MKFINLTPPKSVTSFITGSLSLKEIKENFTEHFYVKYSTLQLIKLTPS